MTLQPDDRPQEFETESRDAVLVEVTGEFDGWVPMTPEQIAELRRRLPSGLRDLLPKPPADPPPPAE